MDTFFEQIVPVKKDVKGIFAVIGIWVAAIILAFLAWGFLIPMGLGTIGLLIIAGVFYFAYKLSCRFSVEYEYIITNGILDVDKIMAKSMRKRMLTFNLSEVESVEKFNPNKKDERKYASNLMACNKTDPNAYVLIASSEGKGTIKLVLSPENRMKEAMKKFMPKFVSNSAFKD